MDICTSDATHKFCRNVVRDDVDGGELERDGLLLGRLHLALHLQTRVHRVDVQDLQPGSEVCRPFPAGLLPVGAVLHRVHVAGVGIGVAASQRKKASQQQSL